MKAIIPAAGLGTRFLPATKVTPKELLPVLNKPVIQYVVEEALEPDDVDGVVIINSHEKPQIDSYFQHNETLERYLHDRAKNAEAQMVQESESLPINFVYQDKPLGLGHAVHCAASYTKDERFFVLLGDYFVPDRQMCVRMKQISDEHGGASVIAVACVPQDQVSRWARLKVLKVLLQMKRAQFGRSLVWLKSPSPKKHPVTFSLSAVIY